MHFLTRIILGSLATILFSGPVTAQDDILVDLRQCRQIQAEPQRLQCYDQLSDSLSAATVQPAPVIADASQGNESPAPPAPPEHQQSQPDTRSSEIMTPEQLRQAQQQLTEERRKLDQEKQRLDQQREQMTQAQSIAKAVPETTSKPTSEPGQPLTEAQKLAAFGAEQIPKSLRGKETTDREEQLDVIRARVITVRGDRRRGYVLVLDNGQVWSQRGTRYIDFLTEENREVIIKRNFLNGYRLDQPATNRRIIIKRIR